MAEKTKAFVNPIETDLSNLKRYPKPRPRCKETESMEKVMQLIENKNSSNKVIHLHGMSGSGKSQIVAAVCDRLNDNPGRIIWHVQCQPDAEMLKFRWTEFARELRRASLITEEELAAIRRELNTGGERKTKSFIDRLNKLNLPTPALLAIEDVGTNEKGMVRSLIDAMRSVTPETLNLQLLIVTRDPDVFYVPDDLEAIEFYATHRIQGFTVSEAREFLGLRGKESSPKLDSLAKELAYSPLRLALATNYCHKYHLAYEEYYDLLGKDQDIVEREKELLDQHSDLGKNHGYDVIMKLLKPAESEGERLRFNVLKMMSFLDNNHIPTLLLKKFIEVITQENAEENAVTYLLEKLRNHFDAQVWKIGDSELLTLHADIFRAVRVSMGENEKRKVLVEVVLALASLLDKDNRLKKDYALLFDLKIHAERVAQHAADHFYSAVGWYVGGYETLLGLSRLNEIIGFAISQHPGFREDNEEDRYFHRALDLIWMVVCSQTGNSFLPSWLTKRKEKKVRTKQLIYFEKGKDPKETAKTVFKTMKQASMSSGELQKILITDWKRVFTIKETHIADMEKKVAKISEVDWDTMKNELIENGQLSGVKVALLESLEKHKVILDQNKLLEMYLAERVASILHSRGRQDNYMKDLLSEEQKERCAWYAELGFQLCDVIFRKTGIKSSFHYILRANNKLSRLTQSRENEDDAEFLARIQEARKEAHSLRQEQGDFYEHGILKIMSGTTWGTMNILKYLVKVNTKVRKRAALVKHFPCRETDGECDELYNLSKANLDTIAIATTCMASCGKYYAARKQFDRAVEAFESALSAGMGGIVQMNPTAYAWALFNYGRAICEGGHQLQNKENAVKQFTQKYQPTMNNNTPTKWRDLLDECKERVNGA